VFSFSRNENLLHPWPAAKDGDYESRKPITTVLPNDAKLYQYVSDQFKKITDFKDAPEPERGNGNFSDWAYYHYGRWSFAAPVWWPIVEKSDTTKITTKENLLAEGKKLYDWLSTQNINGYVEWKEIDHPDFPNQKVEVGGFTPGVSKNPPADSLDHLAATYSAFFLQLATYLPHIEVFTKVEALDNQIYRVTATIKNNGFLPTNGELGSRSQWVRKVKAELKFEGGQKIVSGQRFYLVDGIPGGGSHEQSWLVMGKRGSKAELVVGSPNVGSLQKTVILK
jgi:hypothetical protein